MYGRFWMLPNLLACFLAGLGVAKLGPAQGWEGRKGLWLERARFGLVIGMWVRMIAQGMPQSDFHEIRAFRALAQATLDETPVALFLYERKI